MEDLIFAFGLKKETSSMLDAIAKINNAKVIMFEKLDEFLLAFNDKDPKIVLADIDSILTNNDLLKSQGFSGGEMPDCSMLLIKHPYTTNDDIIKALKLGFYNFLDEPFTDLILSENIRLRLDRDKKNESLESGKLGHDLIRTIFSNKLLASQKDVLKVVAAVEQSNSSVVITDINGDIEYVNPFFKKLTGYDLEEVVGKNPRVLKSGNTTKREYEALWKTISSGRNWKGKFLNKKKNGEEYWESAVIAPVKDINGAIINYIGIKQDITLQVLAEKHLELSEKRYKSLIHDSETIMVVFDPLNGNIVDVNKAACDFYGYTKTEFMNLCMFDFNILSRDEVKKILQSNLENKKHKFIFKHILKSGEIKDVEVNTTTINWQARDVSFSIIYDITDKIKADNDLNLALGKAKESDRLKSAFLANMSHEIRTPMNAILGFAQLLNNKDLSFDEMMSYIRVINNSGNQLLTIIDDIINVSRIEAGIIDINISEFKVNTAIRYIYESFIYKTTQKKIEFKYSLGLADDKSGVRGDKGKFIQIVSNLVNNAIKFTPEGGTIKMGYVIDDGIYKFYVHDTGIGIDKKDQKLIFNRFRQVEHIGKVYGGTGIGLSIVSAFVVKMGGKIWLSSRSGKGSSFYFIIPFKPAFIKREEQWLSKGKYEILKGKTILVAEDEDLNFRLLQEILIPQGVDVVLAIDGKEAVEAVRSNKKIDLVLMDIKMPLLDGYEATRIIKSFNDKIPIIAETAYALSADRAKAIAAGCDDYIAKPIMPDVLLNMLVKHFESSEGA
ncbi:MAG: PAS domain S-box protein [Chlorobi bacterium]|nr:PAS domain S-box protein [Chlorobiota bacterium]